MRQGAERAAFSERGHDLYETPECATRALLKTGELSDFCFELIWEPCAGRGAISRVLIAAGYDTAAHDLIAYEGADKFIYPGHDFLQAKRPDNCWTIVTNPPYMHADKFIRHGLALGCKVIVLLRLMALEGAGRSDLIDTHLRRVWAGIERLPMMHREGWAGKKTKQQSVPFAWFVFEPSARKGPIELTRISWRT